jgi:transposase
MTVIGMDVHQRTSTLAFVDPATGVADVRRIETNPEAIAEAIAQWERPWAVALEATRQAPAVCRWLRELGVEEMHLAHPQKLEMIGRCLSAKTDAKDALLIRNALADGYLPKCYLAPPDVQDLRALTRGRDRFRRTSTQMRNGIRTLLCQAGLACPQTDLCGKAARAELARLFAKLDPWARRTVRWMMEMLRMAERALADLDREIRRQARAHPVARELMRLAGIGPVLSLSLVAELGEIARFAAPAHLHSYAGLAPRTEDSDRHHGRRRLPQRCHKRLRHLAVLAAQGAIRAHAPSKAKAVAERVRARCGKRTAKIAAARMMLTEVWEVWRCVAGIA